MKAKHLLAALACTALLLFAGCGSDNYGGSVSGIDYDVKADSTVSESAVSENEDVQSEVTVMYITVNSIKLEVELEQNSSVEALVEILRQNDIVYTATDYGNFEKVGDIGYTLPRNDEEITTEAGDVILYLGSNICLYYGANTWQFTRIGKINGYSQEELKSILGAGDGSVQITISLN